MAAGGISIRHLRGAPFSGSRRGDNNLPRRQLPSLKSASLRLAAGISFFHPLGFTSRALYKGFESGLLDVWKKAYNVRSLGIYGIDT